MARPDIDAGAGGRFHFVRGRSMMGWMRPPFPQEPARRHHDSVTLHAIGRLVALIPKRRPNSAYSIVMANLDGLEAVADILQAHTRPNLGAWGGEA